MTKPKVKFIDVYWLRKNGQKVKLSPNRISYGKRGKKLYTNVTIYVEFELDGKLEVLVIPKRSPSDGASAPCKCLAVASKLAAYTHDYIYRNGLYTKVIADLLFLSTLREYHEWRNWTSYIYYAGPKRCGFSSYKRKAIR